MSLKMRWLGTACFEISLPSGKTVVTDPYLDDSVSAPVASDQIERCHYIFITHGHYDHVLDVGKLAQRFRPKIFCSAVTAEALIRHQEVDPNLLRRVRPGDVVREPVLTVEILRGVHIDFASEYRRLTGRDLPDNREDGMAVIRHSLKDIFGTTWVPEKFEEWMAKYAQGEQLNFVFEPEDGKRIYMAGTYPDPSVVEAARGVKADITLLQVLSGNALRGREEEVAALALASGCKTVVPQHHDPLFLGAKETDLTELRRILKEKGDLELTELVPGEWYSFD